MTFVGISVEMNAAVVIVHFMLVYNIIMYAYDRSYYNIIISAYALRTNS